MDYEETAAASRPAVAQLEQVRRRIDRATEELRQAKAARADLVRMVVRNHGKHRTHKLSQEQAAQVLGISSGMIRHILTSDPS